MQLHFCKKYFTVINWKEYNSTVCLKKYVTLEFGDKIFCYYMFASYVPNCVLIPKLYDNLLYEGKLEKNLVVSKDKHTIVYNYTKNLNNNIFFIIAKNKNLLLQVLDDNDDEKTRDKK